MNALHMAAADGAKEMVEDILVTVEDKDSELLMGHMEAVEKSPIAIHNAGEFQLMLTKGLYKGFMDGRHGYLMPHGNWELFGKVVGFRLRRSRRHA